MRITIMMKIMMMRNTKMKNSGIYIFYYILDLVI